MRFCERRVTSPQGLGQGCKAAERRALLFPTKRVVVRPNAAFARSLAQAIGPSGTVLTWSSFESSILKTVRDELTARDLLDAEPARLFALVDDSASGSSARVLDMHRLAATEYFHPGMGGRTSIKVVLDALWRSDADMRSQFFALTGKRGDPEIWTS